MIASDESLVTKHQKYVLTPWVAQAGLSTPVIVRAEGIYLYDADGTRYTDMTSGLIAANLGHGHPAVTAAMKDQIDRVCFSPPSWFSDVRAEAGEQLMTLAPWGDEGGRAFFTTSGAAANEDAVKFARALTGRSKVFTYYRSFHGAGSGAAALTGESRRWFNEPSDGMPGVVHFWGPYPYRSPFNTDDPKVETERALAHLERTILAEKSTSVAAILVEPVIGSNGVIIPPDGYLAGMRALCDKYGIVLIFDEVMCGFGRTGAAFGGERLGVVPDMITFAKGVTSAYAPLGGVLIREKLASAFDTTPIPGGHTYAGHALLMATAVAAIKAYKNDGIFARAREIETYLHAGLAKLKAKYEIVGDVRGIGGFFAIEFVKDKKSKEPLVPWQGASMGPMPALYGGLKKRGAFAFGRYNCMNIAPPLITTDEQLDAMIEQLDGAIGDLAAAAASA
jgi:taurine--2-oxoglutarate transaminase